MDEEFRNNMLNESKDKVFELLMEIEENIK
jgi:hypothetical protein